MGPRASDVFLFGARVIETDVKNAERSEEHHRPNRFFGVHVNLGGAINAHIGMLSLCDAVFFLARSVTDANGTEDFWWRDNLKIRTGPIYHDLI